MIVSSLSTVRRIEPKAISTVGRIEPKAISTVNVISSRLMTKEWRHATFSVSSASGKNSRLFEKWQRDNVAKVIGRSCPPSHYRLNKLGIIKSLPRLSNKEDESRFDWSETFDGHVHSRNRDFFFNFKFVCDRGGSQMRTLANVSHFIDYQQRALEGYPENVFYFMNILDGDWAYRFIKDLRRNNGSCDTRIFIGDSLEFGNWWRERFYVPGQLSSRTVGELVEMARERGLTFSKDTSKSELIEMITVDDKAKALSRVIDESLGKFVTDYDDPHIKIPRPCEDQFERMD